MPQTYTCVPAGVPPTTYTNNTQAGTPVLNYDIGFPYIQTTDILVFTGEEGNWTQRNQGTGADEYQISPQGGLATDEVVFNNGVGGTNIMIWRRTDLCNMGRTFTAGSSIRAEDLNQDFTQLLYVLQETGTLIDGIVDGGIGGGGLPLPGDQLDLEDLGDVNITTPANPSWLRWNGTEWQDQPILEDGDTWVADDLHVVTSAAGDDRWLNATGGSVQGRDMITATETGGNVILDVDLAANSGLESTNPGNAAGELRVDDGNGIVVNATGVNVGQGTGITVNADDVAVTSQTVWGQTHDHSAAVDGDMTNVGDITFEAGGGTLDGVDDENIQIAAGGTGIFDVDRNTDINGTLDVSGNTDLGGTLEVAGNVTIESGNDLVFQDDDASNTVTLDVPDDVTTSYTVTLPAAGPGANNRILESDSNGDLSWIATPSGGGGGSSLTIQDEGTSLATAATILNFTGAGVTASGTTATKEINIPGGGDTYDLNATQDGTNIDLNLTSGSGTDNSVVQLTAGAGLSLTRNSANEITIANTAGALDFQGTVDVSDASTIPNAAAVGDAWIQDSDVTTVATEWNAILDPDQTSSDAGDIIAFSTARVDGGAAGVAVLIPTGGNNTTYDLTATDNGDDADINLVPNDGSGTDTVTIAAGTNVTVDHSGSTITINATAGALTIEEEGTALATGATTLNFTGTGVTASGTGAEKTINIPGASAGVTQVNTNDGLDGGPITGTGTIGIADNGVTFARMQDIDQNRIIGRVDASSGDPTALTAAQVRTMLNVADGATDNAGTVTEVSGNNGLTGTVTGSGNIGLAAIANNRVLGNSSGGNAVPTAVQVATNMIADDAVTYAKMQDVAAANRVLGSTTAGGTVSEVQIALGMINATGGAANRVLTINGTNNGLEWTAPAGGFDFPSGTVMLFYQASAPTGFTQVTTQDNKALRIVSGTGGGDGGTVDFTTAFSDKSGSLSGATVGGHTLTTGEMPSHGHMIAAPRNPPCDPGKIAYQSQGCAQNGPTGAFPTGGSGSHTHTITGGTVNFDLEVEYIDVIIASRD